MSARSFRSVFMVASCAGAALGCYLVSLRVASERAALENVETEIVLAPRDIRLLQTEIGTRGRLAQLERWNVKVLALSAPSADQFLDGGFALAKLVAPGSKVDLEAPVVLAAAPAGGPKPQIEGMQRPQPAEDEEGVTAREMLHTASLPRQRATQEARSTVAKAVEKPVAAPAPAPSAGKAPTAKPRPAKPAATASTTTSRPKPTKLAEADPLAPRPAKPVLPANAKDNGSKQ